LWNDLYHSTLLGYCTVTLVLQAASRDFPVSSVIRRPTRLSAFGTYVVVVLEIIFYIIFKPRTPLCDDDDDDDFVLSAAVLP